MTALRIINIVVWLIVFAIMLPGAVSTAFDRRVRRADPLRLATATTALIMAGFAARWLFAPNSDPLWATLYVLSVLNAVHWAVLARVYGRGPLV